MARMRQRLRMIESRAITLKKLIRAPSLQRKPSRESGGPYLSAKKWVWQYATRQCPHSGGYGDVRVIRQCRPFNFPLPSNGDDASCTPPDQREHLFHVVGTNQRIVHLISCHISASTSPLITQYVIWMENNSWEQNITASRLDLVRAR